MCWNAEVSLKTWIFGFIVFIIGLLYGFPLNKLLFFLVFTSMQLLEYYKWTYLKDKKKNEFFSRIGHILIMIEPIFSFFLIQPIYKNIQFILLSLYLLFIGIYNYFNYHKLDFKTVIGKSGHLHWNYMDYDRDFFYKVWTLFFFSGIFLSGDIFIILISLFTFLYSYFSVSIGNEFDSFWCYIVNIAWIYVLLHIIYNQYIK